MDAGRHIVRATGHELTESKSGLPQIKITMEVVEGAAKGERIDYYGGLDGDGAKYTAKDLRTLGFEGDDLTKIELPHKVQIKVEENAQGYMRVKYVDPLGGGTGKPAVPMAQGKAAAVTARMRSMFAVVDAESKTGAPKRPAPITTPPRQTQPQAKPAADDFPSDGAGGNDDDIPF